MLPHIAAYAADDTARRGYSRMVESGEKLSGPEFDQFRNTTVDSFGWNNVSVQVRDRKSDLPKTLLDGVNGCVRAGEMLALMGPSGSGKTTLLNILANRAESMKGSIRASVYVNGGTIKPQTMRTISAYVEQDDALTGSLTVRETISFAARLSLPTTVSAAARKQRIDVLLNAFGLASQADSLIGTPIRKGISGGQKRRVSVAAQLITGPKILFLDEPTSGLDSAASFEVMSHVQRMARRHRIIVIASIHQPSTSTFAMFDKLLLLSHGRTAYNGSVKGVQQYFEAIGHAIPMYMNPAEFIIDFVNTDFARDANEVEQQLNLVHSSWARSPHSNIILHELRAALERNHLQDRNPLDLLQSQTSASILSIQLALIHRSFIKSYRDVIAYGIRVAMYLGLAIMMGTVWLRLSPTQENIQSFINATFFGSAFMSFMAVAYIPAFLEDRALLVKERANGLYGPASFLVANFITGTPYLLVISVLFSVVAYWLSNFRPGAGPFFTWIMWLFLDLLAAESLVVLIASLAPIFVVALAATAFANGLWMCTGGFLVPPSQLNAFWYYAFHFIDYQSYVFKGMMVNEFSDRIYECPRLADGSCGGCMYTSALAEQCRIDGKAVLSAYGYEAGYTGRWVGIMLVIIVVYRLLGWLTLYLRRS